MATSELNANFLITNRESLFERLTSILDFLKAQTTSPNLKAIKARFSFVNEIYENYNKLESQILLHNSNVSDQKSKITYKKERVAVDDLVTAIHELYETLNEGKQDPSPAAANKLPKISMPKFSGCFRQWHSFKDLYISLVHSANISNVEKFQRLKSCLEGEPLRLIEHYALSNENYPLAFQTLFDRYDNPRIAANSYLNGLLNFKPLVNDSYPALQDYLSHHLDSVKAFKALNIADHYDYFVFQVCYSHLSKRIQRAFDAKYPVDCFPTYDNLMNFVQSMLRTLELHHTENERVVKTPTKHSFNVTEQNQNTVISPCYMCKKNHFLYLCPKFLELNVSQRYEVLKRNYLCFNCFKRHQRNLCSSSKRCKKCSGAHHTLLHSTGESKDMVVAEGSSHESSPGENVLSHTVIYPIQNINLSPKSILLGTAQGFIIDSRADTPRPVRILLDPGSQVSCISQELVEKLGIRIKPKITHIKGVSGTSVHSRGRVDCTVYTTPRCNKGFNFNLLVLPVISANLPEVQVHESIKQKFSKYKLADPWFDQSGRVDILLGADYYYDIICNKRIIHGKPNGIHTLFGMVLVGEVPSIKEVNTQQSFLVTFNDLENAITKFWENEELQNNSPPEDDWCENLFRETVRRTPTGRYVVALPVDCDQPQRKLGNNRENALKRLYSMERRFKTNENLKKDYSAFLQEYLDLGHMSVAKHQSNYIIPHHAVFKESTTTKLRVVFDASNLSDSGVSLNQILRKGPKLQPSIFIILSGFRKYKIALVADIKMMYRQIMVREEDRMYQHIFWRNSPNDPVQEFELNTVTYGLAPSSYLSQRVIQKLVIDEGKEFSLAAQALANQIYIDDIVAGGESVEEALELYSQLTALLGRGGFFPRKWSSSSFEVLSRIPSEHKETPLKVHGEDEIMYKVLGLMWDPGLDAFTYKIENFNGKPTKRTILSYIARMFDPMGWLTPFIFYCKYFMQQLWLRGLGWDDSLPPTLQQQWGKIVNNIKHLEKIRVPRYIPVSVANKIDVIGFCDASERGFAAVLLLRCFVEDQLTLHMLGGKSKIAPIKPLSIPRLELNAAYLLSKLFDSFQPFLQQLPIFSVYLLSDSQVVLGWLKTPPYKLKTYICNRVVEILNKTPPTAWHHVKTEENVADCASRGLLPRELVNHSLWWKGPKFLHQREWEPSVVVTNQIELPELKVPSHTLIATIETNAEEFLKKFEKFSSLNKLNRIFAYVLRYVEYSLKRSFPRGPLKVAELRLALNKYIWLNQLHYFQKERALIKTNSPVSSFRALSPFIDQNDVVRVGGRIGNSPLPYDSRHPILVPNNSTVARLIAEYYHRITLHGGPQITRSSVQQQFWIPRIGNLIKSVIFNCTTCRRQNAKPSAPLMSELPPYRFDQVRPFLRTGTDFAGPFVLKETQRRRGPVFKSYVCVFICFSTKAVHFEVVNSLSTNSFLAAVDRFVARRGLCAFLHSDNGTNFVGAARKLSEAEQFLKQNSSIIEEHLTTKKIQWVFNPPAAPHFGGLWEAAVKSFKFHLNRITKGHIFTLEEFTTLTCRIEAILNSRPLSPVSANPLDADTFLTPGHFLIGSALTTPPELPLLDVNTNRLSRWQLIAQSVQSFWKKWSSSYLQSLLPRKKWQVNKDPIKVGDIVFIRQINTSPLSWPLARVEETLPGRDGVCRVAKVRCNGRILIRPVHVFHKVFV